MARRLPEQSLSIVTRENATAIRNAAESDGVAVDRLRIYGVSFAESPDAMRSLCAVPIFLETGLAKLGSCPTRMGEALGCGLPVIVNSGVGDVAGIVRSHNVGVLVEDASDEAMDRAVADLLALREDPGLAARCRSVAEEVFSLKSGAATYDQLYRELAPAAS